MTNRTIYMFGVFSPGDLFFWIPIVSTFFLVGRHRIFWNNLNLFRLILVSIVWAICVIISKELYEFRQLSYFFFYFYAIIIAFIHIQCYGKKFFLLFETVVYKWSLFCVILWCFQVLFPSIASSFFHNFQPTHYGNNFLLIYHYMDPWGDQVYYGIPRNAGFSWEPGRYCIILCLAYACNLLRKGISFKYSENKEGLWLLISILTTMSTTGFCIVFALYAIFGIRMFTLKYILYTGIVLLPILYFAFTLEFMGGKIQRKFDINSVENEVMVSIDYAASDRDSEEHVASLDRPISAYFEIVYNISHEPILGYGRADENSYYSKNISRAFTLTGGLFKLLSHMGIPFGLYLYYILLKSSCTIGEINYEKRRIAIFVVMCIASFSYVTFCVPVFTTFWMYDLFANKEELINDKSK